MAWTSGFFNSMNGDRLYNADQMSSIFEGLITDGVYESVGNKLAVQPNSGLTVQIATGRGWFGKRWVNNDSVYKLTLNSSDVTLNRYVAVVIKVDSTDSVRDVVPYLKYGEFASKPVKPAMTRTETIKEYCLAYVYQKAGSTVIGAADISDTRADESLCGWVTGLITQLGTATLFAQYEAIFNDFMTKETNEFINWFNNLQLTIDDDAIARLNAAIPTSTTINLTTTKWEQRDDVYVQKAIVINVRENKTVFVQAADNTLSEYNEAEIKCTGQGDGELTFTATKLPGKNISVNVVYMGF